MESPDFEWDDAKDLENQRKHGIAFVQAIQIFSDPHTIYEFDEFHSTTEDRHLAIGTFDNSRPIVVIYTVRNGRLRIISARAATPNEARHYANSTRRRQ